MAPSSRRIDVHHHYAPPFWPDFYRSNHLPSPPAAWSLAGDLAEMDRGGTERAILSSFTPYDVGTVQSRRGLSRRLNDYGADLVARHNGRFGLFATLPIPDMDGALAEIDHAFGALHVDGVIVYTNAGDKWLGHPDYAPVWAELNRRKAIVFTHPTTAACCHGLVRDVPDPIVEFDADTTRAIASLIFSQTTTRYPDIRFIFSHGGGTMPYLIERFLGGTSAEIVPGVVTAGQQPPFSMPQQPPGGALTALRRMYYDTAQASNPVAMRALRTVVPVSNILFGTDYWYRGAAETAAALDHGGVFTPNELAQVERGNALRLLPA